jgi:N-acetylmuramoyl-L-alanine amidase
MPKKFLTICCFLAIQFLIYQPSVYALSKVTDVRYWSAPDHTRIVIDSDQPLSFTTMKLKDPLRFVVNVKGARNKISPAKIEIGDKVAKRVRVGQFNRETVRIVIDLVKPINAEVFALKKHLDKLDRLVIDLERSDLKQEKKAERLQQKSKEKFIVVIDPGHGGIDAGAVGRNGTYEKNVVLSLAKQLQSSLNQRKGFKAFLTRNGDYFVPLKKRVEITRDYGADFFISLHTDANFSRKVRGASVYCLSIKGASDEAAKVLAHRENASDRFDGVLTPNSDDRGLDSILIDLVHTQTINDSLRFGGMTLHEMSKVHKIKFKQPKQASFAVLRAAEIPSILIETGFISNASDEKLLKSTSFQKKLASALSSVCIEFGTMLAKREGVTLPTSTAKGDSDRVHIVKKRETLSQIARDHNTTVAELVRVNKLKKADYLIAGKRLLIP